VQFLTNITSPNHHTRVLPIESLVLHNTEGHEASDLPHLTDPHPEDPSKRVSTHYYIKRDGRIRQLVQDGQVAYHAGVSHYASLHSFNDFSLGIELERSRTDPDYPPAQWVALGELTSYLLARFRIPQDLIVAHRWIAPTRKSDPRGWSDEQLLAWTTDLASRCAPARFPWKRYTVAVAVARVRATPEAAGPIAAKLTLGATFLGTPVHGAKVGNSATWIARRYGGYVYGGLVT
jgi:hypothetical protein